ncbi:hypothetical protein JYU34_005040 [Plutella xylostella]|uniref:Uncharacterized protein n=1 Tax=Plutella xylostella TaxID=51655 RepID=A0ABQ7QVN4_PLUXY|nr:hypothetical protein JYU34_005040 [Plutella xylostella]
MRVGWVNRARGAGRGAARDDSDDEGGVSLQAIKNKYKHGQKDVWLRGGWVKRARGAGRGAARDDSDDEGGVSLQAIKNKYKHGQKATAGAAIYSSESDASDVETGRSRKLDRAKALKDSDDEGSDAAPAGDTQSQSGSGSGSGSEQD